MTLKRRTRRHLTQLGERVGVSLDPLTRSRILHGTHTALVLGIETNQAGVIRAAVALWVDHIDKVLKKLATLPEDSEQGKRLVMLERWRLKCANRGGITPWQGEQYLERRLEKAVREGGTKFPEFASIVREYAQREPKLSMDELPVPGQDIQQLLDGEGVER